MYSLKAREQKTNAEILAADMRKRHEDLHQIFVLRAAEKEFEEIGRAHIGERRAKFMDENTLVWTGFEVCVSSRYLQA